MPTYLSKPVFEWPIDWTNPVNGTWGYDLKELQIGFGPELIDPLATYVIQGWEFQITLRDEEIPAVDSFMDALRGRAFPFWLPGPPAGLRIVEGISTSSFKVREQGATAEWSTRLKYLSFEKYADGVTTIQRGQILSVTDNLDGTETVTLSVALDTAVDSSWQIQALYLVRNAEDVEHVEIVAERCQRRSIKVVEIRTDYGSLRGIVPPRQDVFLYRFTAELPDGTIAWRYTSHPTDVTIESSALQSSSSSSSSFSESSSSSSSQSSSSGGESSSSSSSSSSSVSSSSSSSKSSSSSSSSRNSSSSSDADNDSVMWLAGAIEHDGLSRSSKLGGTVTIIGDFDTIEPLRLSLPTRISVQLRVQIYKASLDFTETELIFDGVIRKPELVGRRVRVTGMEFGDMLDGKFPPFYIQRDCNYTVYEPGTCRADKASKQVAVTLTAKAGRVIRVEGSGLAGKPVDYYAEGWVELGSGLSRVVLFVLQSTAANGPVILLTVANPLRLDVPAAGILTPGCAGTRADCIGKHNNFVNFGGHETPRENLTLTAIKTNASTGGKK